MVRVHLSTQINEVRSLMVKYPLNSTAYTDKIIMLVNFNHVINKRCWFKSNGTS